MRTIIISFYTKDWKYPEYAEKLKQDCIRLGLEYDIQELQTTGDYILNTSLKPGFILSMLKKHNRPVLWVDCDGSIVSYPKLFEEIENLQYDFAAKTCPEGFSRKYHVGTLWFNNTEQSLKLIEQWCDCSFNRQKADDSAFDVALKESKTKLKIKPLPQEYFVILKKLTSLIPEGSIIVHRLSESPSKMKRKKKC